MTKLSFSIIKKNRSLLLFPMISGITMILILSIIFMGFWFFPQMLDAPSWMLYIIGFLLYVILFFISYFFQCALVACAYETMEGGQPTVGYGFRKAMDRAGTIFIWAIISAIIGMILRAIEERVPFASRLIGAAWSIATFFVIPIIVFENVGAWASMKRSWAVLKSSWGEALVGNLAVGLIFLLLALPFVLLLVIAFSIGSFWGTAIMLMVALAYLIFIMVLGSAVSSVLQTALYRYSTTGKIDVQLPQWFPPPMTGQGQYPPGTRPTQYPQYSPPPHY